MSRCFIMIRYDVIGGKVNMRLSLLDYEFDKNFKWSASRGHSSVRLSISTSKESGSM